jgi:hypothetical protein
LRPSGFDPVIQDDGAWPNNHWRARGNRFRHRRIGAGDWNRIEQWREYRERHEDRKPHFNLIASPHADNNDWRPLQFIFYNPHERAFSVEKIEVTSAGVQLAPLQQPGIGARPYGGIGTEPDVTRVGKSVAVGWTIEAGADASRSPLHKLFWQPVGNPASISISLTAREISANRRQFSLQTQAVIATASPWTARAIAPNYSDVPPEEPVGHVPPRRSQWWKKMIGNRFQESKTHCRIA